MSPEQWQRVGELFHEALEVAPEEREAWAEQSCSDDPEARRELVSLLRYDRTVAVGFVERSVKSAVLSFIEAGDPMAHGLRVGPFKLVRELGRGGMGTVYLAERDDGQYQTSVAIKLVRPGMDTEIILHRFRRERQILAQLEHPHIARLLDGGTTESGLPYIVMEYVAGQPIDRYCEAQGLSVSGRLRLFLDVCSAVEYAHQHFIVHRDLKPGNILVSDAGSVKLVDFGICKLLHRDALAAPETGSSTMQMLTPDYASPEQVRGDPITAASDIYSLAAVLYELLTSFRPHRITKLTPQALEQAICEHDVIRPSLVPDRARARRLKGDLDNILMLALQKDPQRRYASVEQFSEDIRRHLARQPVRARPATIGYRIYTFARRRRGTLMAAGLAIGCLLAGAGAVWREARVAEANLAAARQLAGVFVFEVHDAVRDLPGSTRARQLIVETGLRFLDGLATNSRRDWDLKRELATAYQRIGDVQGNVSGANLGNTQGALESYRKAMALVDAVAAHDPEDRSAQLDRVTLLERIGGVYGYTGENERALASLRQAQSLGEDMLSRDPGDERAAQRLAQVYVAEGDALWRAGGWAGSIAEHAKAAALLQKLIAAHPEDRAMRQTLAEAYSTMGIDQARLGKLKEGLEQHRRAIGILEDLTRQDPANASYQRALLSAYSHLGDVYGNPKWRSLGDPAAALEAYGRMLAVARRLFETDPANQQAVSDYAIALTRAAAAVSESELPQRLAMLRESLKLLLDIERVNPENTVNRWDLCHGYSLIGDALMESHDRDGAVHAYEESAALAEALLSAGVTSPIPDLVAVRAKLGLEAARKGDRTTAVEDAHRVLELTDPAGPSAKGRAPDVERNLEPRGSAAMGLVYAALARSPRETPGQQREDRKLAAEWLGKSLAAWRVLESDPAFAPPQKKEMQQVEQTLAEVNRAEVSRL